MDAALVLADQHRLTSALCGHWMQFRRPSNGKEVWQKRVGKLRAVIIFTNPLARAGYDTRSIFKRSLTGLNSELSFSYTSCLTKAEELSLPYYLPIAARGVMVMVLGNGHGDTSSNPWRD